MTEFAHDPETGQTYMRAPGRRWVPVSEAEADQIERADQLGPARAAYAGLKNSVQQLAAGAGTMIGVPDAPEELERLRAEQGGLRAVHPVASTAGALTPDIGLAAATGGASVLGSIGRGAAVDFALGALRSPEAPLEAGARNAAIGAAAGGAVAGAAKLGAIGGDLVGKFRGTVQDVAAAHGPQSMHGPRSIGAAENLDPSYASSERALAGFLQPEELDELAADFGAGKIYTPADAAALRARAGTPELGRADAWREYEELGRSNVAADRVMGAGRSINEIRANADDVAVQVVMRELGETSATRLTSQNLNRLEVELGETFEHAAKEAGDFVFQRSDLARLADIAEDASADDAATVGRYVTRIFRDAPGTERVLAGDQANATMLSDHARQYRTRLGNEIVAAMRQGQVQRIASLRDVQQVLDDVLDRQIGRETADALEEARYRWQILTAVRGSTATTDAGGGLNLRSFMTAMQRGVNRGGRITKKTKEGDQFYRTMETLAYLTTRVVPNSGTAQRIIAQSAPQAVGLLGAYWAGKQIFGE
ncbi:MAG: hypothetical protein ACPGNV_18090 [Mangrovicoccus sp.]